MEEKPVCEGCSKPIDLTDEHLVIEAKKKGEKETFLCAQCLTETQAALEEETHNPNIPLALVFGLGAAVVAGFIWYFLVTLTGWQVGIVAILMGWLVGQGIVWGAGHKRGAPLQWISVLLTIVAILFSEYMIFNHFFHEEGLVGNLPIDIFFEVYGAYFGEGTGFLDILFFGIALWQAYVTPRQRALKGQIIPRAMPQVSN